MPSRSNSTSSGSPILDCATRRRNSPKSRISRPLNLRMRSPGRIPAWAAGESGPTASTSAPRASARPKREAEMSSRGRKTTPSTGRAAPPGRRMSSTTRRTAFDGMAKPMPWLPPDCEKMKLLMPTISPRMLTRGPPELPGLIGASVWKNSLSVSLANSLSRALMMPWVMVSCRPKGFPTANTNCPARTSSESAKASGRRCSASIFITAMSSVSS